MNKKILSIAVAGAMTAPMATQAVKYKLSGQVNRAVVFQDDGEQSAVRNVDSIASGTRFRLKGSEDLGNGMKVGIYYESQWSSAIPGANTIVVNYSQASDVIAGFDDKAWNIGFDHTLPRAGVDLYASFFIPNWIRPPGCPASKTTTPSCSARGSSLIRPEPLVSVRKE